MGDETKPAKPRARTWIWVTVLVTLVCGGPLALLGWGALVWDEIGEGQEMPCAAALSFAEATLPRSARDATCRGWNWQDDQVAADFRMPSGEVAGWLAGTYPGATVRTVGSCGADLCLDASYDSAGLASVAVEVTYEGRRPALVHLVATSW
ncbi:hypothetical protein M5362_16360 [Streptomyces sp. Je 1-79]|uniref:hypothetical protein n=1 Tax=Streptomyces sp. Je 1-79 TaxID=2943847 RepID=UPI0021A2DAE2|nr:hypothetical protein [Streptomyces sp. Je 1-79]MCT4354704.1 hypothetical protein [Streptomyces sp. Je 1-79]